MLDLVRATRQNFWLQPPLCRQPTQGPQAQNRPKGSRSCPVSPPSLERASVNLAPVSPPDTPAVRVPGGPAASKPVSHPSTCGTASISVGPFVSAQVQVKDRGFSGGNVVPGHTSLDIVGSRGHRGGTGPGSSPRLPDALPTLPMPESPASCRHRASRASVRPLQASGTCLEVPSSDESQTLQHTQTFLTGAICKSHCLASLEKSEPRQASRAS